MRPQRISWMVMAQALAALMLLTSACGGGGGTGNTPQAEGKLKPKYGGTLTAVKLSNMSFMDPTRSAGGTDFPFRDLYSGYLMDITEQGELRPLIAEAWTIPDPTTIQLKLKSGVTFHDGTPVDAAAVKFNIERGKDANTKSPWRSNYLEIAEVQTPDPLTVVLKLVAPDSSLLYSMRGGAGALVSPTAVQKWGDDFERHVVSAGPFEVEKYTPDAELVLKRFENYPFKDADGNKLPYLDRIRVQIITDATVAYASLESNDVQVLPEGVPAAMVKKAQANKDLTVYTLKQSGVVILGFHIQDPASPFDNLDLRKAVAYGLDRDEIVRTVYDGYASPGTGGVIPPSMWANDKSLQGYAYDPAKAKEYVIKAGYPNGVKVYGLCYPTSKVLAEAIQVQLKRIGIDMVIDAMELVTFDKEWRTLGAQHTIAFSGYNHSADPDRAMTGFFGTGGGYSLPWVKVPDVDKLLQQARSTYDRNERIKYYTQFQRLILDTAQMLPVVYNDKYMATRSYVKGFNGGYHLYGDLRWSWLDK